MIQSLATRRGGYLMILVLVFSSVFLTITASFITFIIVQNKLVTNRIHFEQAGVIAEAGLEYYKWYLAHNPNDFTFGTTTSGPYIFSYEDPEGGIIGTYELDISTNQFCGETTNVEVISIGYTSTNPAVQRTMRARYARPTVAEYAFILNSAVWAGADRVISGPYHSNNGIRMDGRNDSVVTSGVSSWSCTPSYGCTPTTTRNGVFTTTANANPALFEYPSAPVNFAGITVDLNQLKTRAQTGGGRYFPTITNGSNRFGYRVIFNSNGTVTVRRVSGTLNYWGYSSENDWQQERHIISNSNTILETFTPPSSCPVLFFEDKVWLEGTVRDKVTVVSADLINPAVSTSIILQGNITYTSATTSGLLAIAQQDVLIGVDVPDNMYINGIFIAQNGRYGRNHYVSSGGYSLPAGYTGFRFRNSENMNGTIVSNGRVGTQWTNSGMTVSGFYSRFNSYDRNLVADPPPFVPVTSDVFRYSDWQDQN